LLPEKSQKPDFPPAYYVFRSERREKLFSLLLTRVFSGSLLHYLSEVLSTSNNVYEKERLPKHNRVFPLVIKNEFLLQALKSVNLENRLVENAFKCIIMKILVNHVEK
jgi:hypothetical protein